MIYNTEADLHTLLDSLADGEHIKATWVFDNHTTTVEGPVTTDVSGVWCDHCIRWEDGIINPYLTSLEVTRDEEVTVTRDDEKALHALIDSLEDGDTVTAEWRSENWTATLIGAAQVSGEYCWVLGHFDLVLRWDNGILNCALHSVTVSRRAVQRWEREDSE